MSFRQRSHKLSIDNQKTSRPKYEKDKSLFFSENSVFQKFRLDTLNAVLIRLPMFFRQKYKIDRYVKLIKLKFLHDIAQSKQKSVLMNPPVSTCYWTKSFAKIQEKMIKIHIFLKSLFFPNMLSGHVEYNFNNHAEGSAGRTNFKKFHCSKNKFFPQSDPLDGCKSVLMNQEFFFTKSGKFQPQVEKSRIFTPLDQTVFALSPKVMAKIWNFRGTYFIQRFLWTNRIQV